MIKWNETMILQQVKQPCPCQTLTKVFITRQCEGSYSQGAQWMDMDTTQCNLTERLLQLCEALSLSNKPAETVAEILVNVTAAPATLVPSEVTVAAFVLEVLTLAAAENKSVRHQYNYAQIELQRCSSSILTFCFNNVIVGESQLSELY